MSDTCWLHLMFARKDLEKFNEVLKDEMRPDENGEWWDEDQNLEDDDEVSVIIYKAINGWCNQIENLVKAGLTFSGEHSAGGSYGPMAFACYKGEYVELNTDIEGNPTVLVSRPGVVDNKEMERVKKYYEIIEKTEKE